MANQQVFTPLSELTIDRQDWLISVKVHNVWTQAFKNSPSQVASKDMVLIDQQGNRIHATVKKNLLHNFADSLEVGNTIEINTFVVSPYCGKYLMADNPHKIIFCRATKVKRVAGFDMLGEGYSFIPYADILAGQLNINIAFDVVGQVVDTGNMKIKMQDGRQTKLLTCVLQDVDGTKLDCSLWGDYAVQLNSFIEKSKSSTDVTVMFIHVAFAKQWGDSYQISNSFFGTKVYLNNDIQPIVEFRKRLLQNDEGNAMPTPPPVLTVNTVVETNSDFYMRFPRKTIDCLRTIRETTHCVVVATLLSVATEDGWFYFICKECAKTATRNLDSTHGSYQFNCYECGPINEVETRVRTVIRVEDSSGATSFSMFGDVVAADPTVLPNEWETYLNQQIVFKIKVSMYNVTNECAGYTVGRCTDDPDVVSAQLKRPVATLLEMPPNKHDFVTPTSKGFASNSGVNISPLPFEDLDMEGSSQKRKSQSPGDDIVTKNSSSKKHLLTDGCHYMHL